MASAGLALLLLLCLHLAVATPAAPDLCQAGQDLGQGWRAALLHLARKAGVVPDVTRSTFCCSLEAISRCLARSSLKVTLLVPA